VQVSTDEVYGSAPEGIRFDEEGALRPSSPYAASKAAADLLVHAAVTSWGTDAVITRCCNNYGPWQFPEKLIPLMITNLMEGLPLPIYGDGLQVREWIHVRDHCAALWAVWERGLAGRLYNIGTGQEVSNLELVKTLVRLAGADQESITFVRDRPGHDRRYALDSSRLRQELAWHPEIPLTTGLEETMTWYRDNRAWWEQVRSGAYRDWYDRKYGGTDQGPESDQPSS
jgi:dTDP-glucose 4,6-dehydratase